MLDALIIRIPVLEPSSNPLLPGVQCGGTGVIYLFLNKWISTCLKLHMS